MGILVIAVLAFFLGQYLAYKGKNIFKNGI